MVSVTQVFVILQEMADPAGGVEFISDPTIEAQFIFDPTLGCVAVEFQKCIADDYV
jgi:hypothetical protein